MGCSPHLPPATPLDGLFGHLKSMPLTLFHMWAASSPPLPLMSSPVPEQPLSSDSQQQVSARYCGAGLPMASAPAPAHITITAPNPTMTAIPPIANQTDTSTGGVTTRAGIRIDQYFQEPLQMRVLHSCGLPFAANSLWPTIGVPWLSPPPKPLPTIHPLAHTI